MPCGTAGTGSAIWSASCARSFSTPASPGGGGGGAAEAQNGCARIVFLAERQIGAELAKAKKTEEVKGKAGRPRKSSEARTISPATAEEVGIPRQRQQEFQQLAAAPASAIEHAVAQANAEQRPVTKADLKKAVEEAVGFKDPRPSL